MIYKTLKKVSDVCQVLDKRTYPATGTVNGITFTHNGDGSYTANGTYASSSGSYFYFCDTANKNLVKLVANHKYLVLNGAYYEAGTYSVWMVVNNQLVADSNATGLANYYNEKTYTPKKNEEASLSMDLTHKPNVDTINFTFKPQLFDLTEMYGAGNEPTSVEQFRQDFPEELYDYKPYCFVKSYKTLLKATDNKIIPSYKKSLACKTKNLFDISKLQAYTPETLPISTAGIYNGSIIARASTNSSVCESGKTLKELCPDLVAGERCTLSFETSSRSYTIYLRGANEYWYKYKSSVVTEAMLNSLVGFYANYPELTVATIINFQIEKGDTATEYHPYGYL